MNLFTNLNNILFVFLKWIDCGGGEDDVWKTNIRYYNDTIITRLSFELLHDPILGIYTYIHIYIYIYIQIKSYREHIIMFWA